MKIFGRRYENGEPVGIELHGDRIARIDPATPDGPLSDWPYVAPGFFDLQINGHAGVWFCKDGLTPEEVLTTLRHHFRFGITRLFPTLITASYEALLGGFKAIRQACEQERWADLMAPGCHLEGPYIAREDGPRGAHPLTQVRACDWNEFQRLQDAAGGRIKLLTLAPECPGAIEFIRKAVAARVTISIGHTGATPEQVRAAVDAGATMSTHLGNGAHGQLRRHPNYIWEQLGDARLAACLITDGHHIPESFIRSVIRSKTPWRTVITCDAAGLAGCPPGTYQIESGAVEILPIGKIVVADQPQFLAGSAQLTNTCVEHALAVAGVSLKDAVDMAGRIPASLVGLEEITLRRGSRADLVQFQYSGPGSKLEVLRTIAAGVVQYDGASGNVR